MVLVVIVIVLKLVIYGAAESAYVQDCEDVRQEAYTRYASYGSRAFVTEVIDTVHEDCVAGATESGYRRTTKLNRRQYFALMDMVFSEVQRRK